MPDPAELKAMEPIPQEWIKHLVDQYIAMATKLGPHSPMGAAMMLRAEHAMDLVKAFRERNARPR
jgi:hypothetical protein